MFPAFFPSKTSHFSDHRPSHQAVEAPEATTKRRKADFFSGEAMMVGGDNGGD